MSGGLYARPTRCKYCDRVFDFPTLTTDITERGVPVKTRTCGDCIWEMGQDEELRERRARAEEESRRSTASLSDQSVSTVNCHKSSQSSLALGDRNTGEADSTDRSTESPEQVHLHLGTRTESTQPEDRSSSEPRTSQPRPLSGVHQLLN